jgi:hypothetical protein
VLPPVLALLFPLLELLLYMFESGCMLLLLFVQDDVDEFVVEELVVEDVALLLLAFRLLAVSRKLDEYSEDDEEVDEDVDVLRENTPLDAFEFVVELVRPPPLLLLLLLPLELELMFKFDSLISG